LNAAGTRFARDVATATKSTEQQVTSVSYVVSPNYRAGSDPSQINKNRNPNDPNMITTGAYGSAFALTLDNVSNSDGSKAQKLTYQAYDGKTNGTFSAVSESGTGTDLVGAFQSLLATMQADGEMTNGTGAQLQGAFAQLEAKSSDGSTEASVSGGGTLVMVGGPIPFSKISSYQNNLVDTVINNLSVELSHDYTA
jgi:hypothetical protein